MTRFLLDVNLLLALAWPNHQHHGAAHDWFADRGRKAWATCTLTQLGFIRLSSNPSYSGVRLTPGDAADLLRRWTNQKSHAFWPSISCDERALFVHCTGHQQVNDAWLVAMAIHQKGKLATFDMRLLGHAAGKSVVELVPT